MHPTFEANQKPGVSSHYMSLASAEEQSEEAPDSARRELVSYGVDQCQGIGPQLVGMDICCTYPYQTCIDYSRTCALDLSSRRSPPHDPKDPRERSMRRLTV